MVSGEHRNDSAVDASIGTEAKAAVLGDCGAALGQDSDPARKKKAVDLSITIEPKSHPPAVSFLFDHEAKPTDAFRGVHKHTPAFLVCGGPSMRDFNWPLLEQPGILTASLNNAPLTKCYQTHDLRDVFRPSLWFSVDKPQTFHEAILKDPAVAKFFKIKFRKAHKFRTWHKGHWQAASNYFGGKLNECPNMWYYQHCKSQSVDEFLRLPSPTWWANPHRSVMFVAIRVLFYMGIRRIYLLGCDFKQEAGASSYGFDDPMPLNRASYNTQKLRGLDDVFSKLRPHFEEYGLQVLNCTPGGHLHAFGRVSVKDAIADAQRYLPQSVSAKGLYLK